jgi:hypothetical protein
MYDLKMAKQGRNMNREVHNIVCKFSEVYAQHLSMCSDSTIHRNIRYDHMRGIGNITPREQI